jgi:hypothetical protein
LPEAIGLSLVTCLTEDRVLEYIGGQLTADVHRATLEHLDRCVPCRELVSMLAGDSAAHSGRMARTDLVPSQLFTGEAAGVAKKFGPYTTVGLLGYGAMGVVYRAREQATGKLVALKTIRALHSVSFASLQREITFLENTRHPNIVKIFGHDLRSTEPWYAMELLQGETLADYRRGDDGKKKAVDRVEAVAGVLDLFIRLCSPLGFMHGAGIVHCDLKPANVFLRDGHEPVLVDFGLVTRHSGGIGREALEVTGRGRGTLKYMAPEIIRGHLPDARADLYSVGCMLYECLTGEPPFVATDSAALIDQQLHLAVVPPSERVKACPASLDTLLVKLLAKDKRQRLGHAAELCRMLSAIAVPLRPAPILPKTDSTTNASYFFRAPLVGREADLARVLAEVGEGATRLFVVCGPSGIGRTSFVAEVSQQAMLRGIAVVTGECDGHRAPFAAFRRLFEAVRDHCREHGRVETHRLFGKHLGLLASYESCWVDLPGAADAQAPPVLPAAAARERLLAALIQVIAAFAGGSRLLVSIDDLQWADDLSLALIERLRQECDGVVLLVSCRTDAWARPDGGDEQATVTLKRWFDQASTVRLTLQRLERGEIASLIAETLSGTPPPAQLVDFVAQRAAGMPFAALEYLRSLADEKALRVDGSAWSFDMSVLAATFEVLPGELEGLMRRRLTRLSEQSRAAIHTAAVIGRTFHFPLVSAVCDPRHDVERGIEEATRMQVIEPVPGGGFRFTHDQILGLAYGEMTSVEREALHLAVATHLEAEVRQTSQIAEHAAALAHHFERGRLSARAIDCFETAGQHALDRSAYADAERFFANALRLAQTAPMSFSRLRQARWERQRCDALQGLGKVEESVDAIRRAAHLLGHPLPRRQTGLAWQLVGGAARQAAHQMFLRRRGPSQDADALQESARVFERLHRAAYYLGRDRDLMLATVAALNAAESAPPMPERVTAYANVAATAGVIRVPRLAERYFGLAREALHRTPDPAAESWLDLLHGAYLAGRGQRDGAIEGFDSSIALADQITFFRRRDEAGSARIGIDVLAGHTRRMQPRIASLEQASTERGDAQLVSWALTLRLECALITGALDDFDPLLERLHHLVSQVGLPDRAWSLGLEVLAHHRLGRPTLALETAARAEALMAKVPPVYWSFVNSYAALAEVFVASIGEGRSAGRPSRVAAAKRACARLESIARTFPIAQPLARLHQGQLGLALGKPARSAIEAWQDGLAMTEQLHLPYYGARLHQAIAQTLPEKDRTRQTHAASAEALLASL